MKDSKNEVLNKAADENVLAGVLDGAGLTDDLIAEVYGGTAEQGEGNDSGCYHPPAPPR